ncbi:MAG: hypothetical protein WC052_04730 [Patescibacteria group bacterium]|jgi:hypothetical protein
MSHLVMDIVTYDLPNGTKAYRTLIYRIPDTFKEYIEDPHKEDGNDSV